jgi:hypothetical protein
LFSPSPLPFFCSCILLWCPVLRCTGRDCGRTRTTPACADGVIRCCTLLPIACAALCLMRICWPAALRCVLRHGDRSCACAAAFLFSFLLLSLFAGGRWCHYLPLDTVLPAVPAVGRKKKVRRTFIQPAWNSSAGAGKNLKHGETCLPVAASVSCASVNLRCTEGWYLLPDACSGPLAPGRHSISRDGYGGCRGTRWWWYCRFYLCTRRSLRKVLRRDLA